MFVFTCISIFFDYMENEKGKHLYTSRLSSLRETIQISVRSCDQEAYCAGVFALNMCLFQQPQQLPESCHGNET